MKENRIIFARVRYERQRLGAKQDEFGRLIGSKRANYAAKELGRVPWNYSEMVILRDYINANLPKDEDRLTLDVLFYATSVPNKERKLKHSSA